jgi:hypothetical protein
MTPKSKILSLSVICVIAIGVLSVGLMDRSPQRRFPDGSPILTGSKVKGVVDIVKIVNGDATIKGWAVDSKKLQPAHQVIAFVNGRRVAQATPNENRPNLSRIMISKNVTKAGFSVFIPRLELGALPNAADVRLFAVSGEGAAELKYPANYPFRPNRELLDIVESNGAEILALRNQLGKIRSSIDDNNWALKALIASFGAEGPETSRRALTPRRIYLTQRDAYGILDRGQSSFNDTSAKQRVPCASIPRDKRTAVMLIFGQSNSTNQGKGKFSPDGGVYNFNFFDGQCYLAKDPLLGTSGKGGSFASRLGDRLVKAKIFDTVVLVPIGVGGTYMEDWTLGGIHFRRIPVAIQRLANAGLPVTHLIWHQGEGNTGSMSNPEAYKNNFLAMLNAIRSYRVSAPIFVPLVSVCGGAPDEITRRGQRALVNPAHGIYPGPDTDSLRLNYRYDNCHLNSAGLEAHAEMWFRTIKHTQSAPPNDKGVRLTAGMLGLKPPPSSPATAKPALAKTIPPGAEVKVEYSSVGSTDRVIPINKGEVKATDGASILGPNINISDKARQLEVRILVRGHVTKNNSFVVAGFREGTASPAFLVHQKGKPGETIVINETLNIPAQRPGVVHFDIRVGLAKPGGRLFINSDPKGKFKLGPLSHVAIKEK